VTDRAPIRGPNVLVIIGGPAGVGKSRLAHALGRRTGSTVAQVDDLQTAIETLVPPERLPEYFVPSRTYLRTDSPDDINDAIEQISAFYSPAVLGVIENRIESGTSTVLEGDFVSPEAAAQAGALGAASLFLLASEDEIRANFLQRDGDEQPQRARVSATHSRRLAAKCAALGIATVNARPFDTLLLRACGALGLVSVVSPQVTAQSEGDVGGDDVEFRFET
jgi:2-phosphoglycerate kinase